MRPHEMIQEHRLRGYLYAAMLVTAAGTLTCGCASVKTMPPGPETQGVRLRPPSEIYVQPFAIDSGRWDGRAGDEAIRIQVRDWLAGSLEQHLADIAATRLLTSDPPQSGWLVTGRFLRVNPGSKIQRMFFGNLGGGASKLETRVEVYDLAVSSAEPILSFTTTGGSNLTGGLSGAAIGVDNDIDRTAREIRNYLRDRIWPHDAEAEESDEQPAALEAIEVDPQTP